MNRVELIGRLTKQITLWQTKAQLSGASFILAVDRKKKPDGTRETDFIPCVAYGRTAEVLEQYTDKGHRLAVSGRIRTGHVDRDDGRTYTYDVVVEEFDFLERKEPKPETFGEEIDESELPF